MSLKSGKKWVMWYKFEQSDWFGIKYHIGILVYSDHIHLGHFLCCSSRAVLYLPTDLAPQYGFVQRNEHLPSDPDSDDTLYFDMLDKYMEPPPELNHVLYVDWAEKYMLARSSSSHITNTLTQPHSTRTYIDMKGRKWKECKTEAVARWKFICPMVTTKSNTTCNS